MRNIASKLMPINPGAILEKRDDFPGAAALVDLLKPHYDLAMLHLQPMIASETMSAVERLQQKLPAINLPDSLAEEVRRNLTSLQESAFQLEAADKMERAEEIREVAGVIGDMLGVIEKTQLTTKREGHAHS
ncbi:MAG: hypothetical protein SFT92_03600 [Rickettsiales bacterium]|nr:hypothetical protein [Rickettsiales bacterium]